MTPAETRLLIKASEAARMLALAERTLYALSKRGLIPTIRIGRTVRYSVSDLEAFIRRARQGGPNDAGTT